MNNTFYGSLSKIQKINFQFDRVFPNRATMDQEAELGYYIAEGSSEKIPPVFNGRYVLVDYHEGDVVDRTVRIGYNDNGSIVAAPGISFGPGGVSLENGSMVTVIGEYNENHEYTSYSVPQLYRYDEEEEEKFQIVEYIANNNPADSLSTYEKNLMIDGQQYNNIGRGWDSTVWQKTYQNGKPTYIMIAELNSFNPTITLAVDAPKEVPLNPYIGTDSTLDFYKIHMQPSAGFRIKEAERGTARILTGANSATKTTLSSDIKSYPSDISGDVAYYNGVNEDKLGKIPLAIYYNKKGINKYISASNAKESVQNAEKWAIEDGDSIRFNYTGKSGKQYYQEGSSDVDFGIDTYELSIMLPSLGESISKILDLAYGENEYFNADGLHLYYKNPEGVTDSSDNADFTAAYFSNKTDKRGFRNTDIYWNSKQGLRLTKKDRGEKVFNSKGLNSLAGMINTTHDLMGMIIRDYKKDDITEISPANLNNVKEWDPTKIYFIDGHYYYKTKKYTWTPYEVNSLKSNDLIYRQIHFLPENLIQGANALDDPADDDITLTNEINPNFIYFVDAEHNGTGHQRNIIYRESWEEYPEIPDSESNVTFDAEKSSLFKTKYVNYIRVKDEKDLIEGAVYGIIAESVGDESIEDTPELGADYFYYNTTSEYGTGVYSKENDSSYPRGIYYDLSNIQSCKVNQEFYVPNLYYVYDKTLKVTKLATAGSLQSLIGNDTYTYEPNSNYIFYRNVTAGEGTVIEEDPDVFDLKRVSIPVNRYEYTNNHLIIYKTADKNEIIEDIAFLSADSILNKNGRDNIEFSLENSNVPIFYWTKQYTNSEKQYYYTKDELTQLNFDLSEWNIPKHKLRETSDGSIPVWIPDPSSQIYSLIDFEENKYFYFYSPELFVLETLNRLKTSEGQERNENHRYYEIDLKQVKKIFQNAGGAYYKTKDGDYLVYPTFHLKDPTQNSLTNTNYPLEGEVWQSAQPRFIPLGSAEKFRIFKPDVYYKTPGGVTAKEFEIDEENPYYERIGNIVGNSEPYWADGMEWDQPNAPNNVIFGERTLTWGAQEIDGLGEEMNTLFGLILKVNQMLQLGNETTRDSNTIQGILNQTKDTLNMLKSFGFSFSSFQLKNKSLQNIGNPLVANSAGDTVDIVSNNSLINLNISNNKLRFDETFLKVERDLNKNISYLSLGSPQESENNPQIIEYSKTFNESPKDFVVNRQGKGLAFNGDGISFHSTNLNPDVNFIQETFNNINFNINSNKIWRFSRVFFRANSLKEFTLILNNSSVQNDTVKVVRPFNFDWGPFVYSKQGEQFLYATISGASFRLNPNRRFELTLYDTPSSIPGDNYPHDFVIRNNGNIVYSNYSFTFNSYNDNNVIVSGTLSSQLKNGTLSFYVDDFLLNPDVSEVPFSGIVYEDTSLSSITILNNGNVFYTIPNYRIGTAGATRNYNYTANKYLEDGELEIKIGNNTLITMDEFIAPKPPAANLVGEFDNEGKFIAYGGLAVRGKRPTYNINSDEYPLVISNASHPLRFDWEAGITGRDIPEYSYLDENSFTYSENDFSLDFNSMEFSLDTEKNFMYKINTEDNYFAGTPNSNSVIKLLNNENEILNEPIVFIENGIMTDDLAIGDDIEDGTLSIYINDVLLHEESDFLAPAVIEGTSGRLMLYSEGIPLMKIQTTLDEDVDDGSSEEEPVETNSSLWGVQFGRGTIAERNIQSKNQDSRNAVIDLDPNDVLSYGNLPEDCYEFQNSGYYNNGITINYDGIYKLQGSVALKVSKNVTGVKIWLLKRSPDAQGYQDLTVINSTFESLDPSAYGTTDVESSGVYAVNAKLTSLNAGDTIFLACTILPGRDEGPGTGGGGGAGQYGQITVLQSNPGTYLLVEKVANLSE